jgi:hypothetical protein
MKYVVFAVVLAVALMSGSAAAQTTSPKKASSRAHSTKAHKQKPGLKLVQPTGVFHPTCNLDSGSVGYYFFPANLGAKWTMRIMTQIFDNHSKLVRADTSYSFERVLSDSNTTLQGAPVLECESSAPYKKGDELTTRTMPVTYYIDDSVAMLVINHSINSGENRFMLVAPLKVGTRWHDKSEDTAVSEIIAVSEPVSVPYGSFSRSIVVRTRTMDGDLSKYFVPGVGIAKMVYRGWPERLNGTVVVTTELIALDRGDTTRSIRNRFAKKSL